MTVYIQRGGKSNIFANISASVANYFSPPKRVAIQGLIDDFKSKHGGALLEELRSFFDTNYITAWGAKPDYEDLYQEMSTGDVVLYRTDYSGESDRYIRYVQIAKKLVGDDYPTELREKISKEIWGNEEFTLLWFSDDPIIELTATEGDFEQLVQEVKPSFSFQEWFRGQGDNFKRLDPEWVDYHGTTEEFIRSLARNEPSPRRTDIREYRLIKLNQEPADIRWFEHPTEISGPAHLIEADKGPGTPLKSLYDVRNDAATVIYDDGEVVGQGRIGYVGTDQRREINGTSAAITDYKEFSSPVPAISLPNSLQAELNSPDPIVPVSDTVFEAVGDRMALGPEVSNEEYLRENEDEASAPDDGGESDNEASVPDYEDLVWNTWSAEKRNPLQEAKPPEPPANLKFPDDQSVEFMHRIHDALNSGKHIMLTGPPGAGKTELAKYLCSHYVQDRYELVTATDDWSTFDTVGGYRPKKDNSLEFQPGIFLKRFLDTTDSQPEPKNEWLIVDEINRSDIDKAFGSLFSALTGDTVTLPFETETGEIVLVGDYEQVKDTLVTDNRYYIPDNWRMIATMNTDDKTSLYKMSYAFMRRFAFVSVPVPDPNDIDEDLADEYMTRWEFEVPNDVEGYDDDEDLREDLKRDIKQLWENIQKYRPVGPAIIEDVLTQTVTQLQRGGPLEYTPGLRMHVVPQLEGVPSEDIDEMFTGLEDHSSIRCDKEELKSFANTFLNTNI